MISFDFAIDFSIFTILLLTYVWMDGQTDGQNNGQTDRIMGGQASEWMDMQYTCIDMQKTMIFQQILQFLQKRYGPTDRRTNQQTDRPTDRRTNPLIEMRQPHLKKGNHYNGVGMYLKKGGKFEITLKAWVCFYERNLFGGKNQIFEFDDVTICVNDINFVRAK